MAVSGSAVTVAFLVWDTSANAGKTGDAANLTLRLVKDGLEATPAGTPVEIDATNAPGIYKLALTAAENTGTAMTLAGKSATAGIVVVPLSWHNMEDAGSGAAAITLTVQDGDGTAIQGVPVTLQSSGGTNVQTTNSDGEVTFRRDDGDWAYVIGDTASYTGASGTVTVASGAVSSPAGGILTITAVALPTPSSASCYALYNTETDEQDLAFGASGITVQVIDLSEAGRVDATNNRFRSIMGRSASTDANGQWSLDIPIQAFTACAKLTLRRTWTDAGEETQSEDWVCVLAAPSSGTQVCWADLSPVRA